MSCYWLISSRSSLFCFRFSFFVAFILFCFFCIFLLVVVLLRLCFLLYASNYSQNIFPYHCGVLFFLVSCFFCLMTLFFLCIFLHSLFYFLLLKVMLSCGAAIFHSSPTSKYICSDRSYHFHYIHLLSFGVAFCFGMGILQYVKKKKKQFSTQNSSNDFIELGWCLWEFVLFIDKIY